MKTSVRVIGTLRVVRGRRTTTKFRTQQAAGLLAYLACHRSRPASRDLLLEVLWPGEDPSLTRQRLSQAICSIRRVLEPDRSSHGKLVHADRDSVRLTTKVDIDLEHLRQALRDAETAKDPIERNLQLERAMNVYQGPLLEDRTEEWIHPLRTSLETQVKNAFDGHRQRFETSGDLKRAEALAYRVAALDPYDEDAHTSWFRLLTARGKRTEALREYEAFAQRLITELGIAPDPDTAEIVAGNVVDAAKKITPSASHAESQPWSGSVREGATACLTVIEATDTAARSSLVRVLRLSGNRVVSHQLGKGRTAVAFLRASEALSAVSAIRDAWRKSGSDGAPPSIVASMTEIQSAEAVLDGELVHELARVLESVEPGWTLVTRTVLELARPGEVGAIAVRSLAPQEDQSSKVGVEPDEKAGVGPKPEYFALRALSAPRSEDPVSKLDERARTNLSPARTRFFGREAEMAEVTERILAGDRILTLLGLGGTGKTRLSQEVVRALESDLEGGAWFVDLSSASDPRQIFSEVCSSVGLTVRRNQEPLPLLSQHFAGTHTLVVLDNLEQLLPNAAAHIESLSSALPNVRLLITSRRPVGLDGEHQVRLPPLPVPELSQTPEASQTVASMQMFLDRARVHEPDFRLTSRNLDSVVRLVRHLEGLPLALELAAARVPILSPSQIMRRFENRTDVNDRHEQKPERHRRLANVIDWSYRMLDRQAQRVLAALSTFRGSFDLPAAESVLEDPLVGDALAILVDASLLVSEYGDEPRFKMLETVRTYAAAKLSRAQATRLGDRHAEHYARMAKSLSPDLVGGNTGGTVHRLEREDANFRAAIDYWTTSAERARSRKGRRHALASIVRMVDSLAEFWTLRGQSREGLALVKKILQEESELSPKLLAKALFFAGTFAEHAGRFEESDPFLTRAVARLRELGDDDYLARALKARGVLAFDRGQLDDAETFHREALELHRELGDVRATAQSIQNLGNVHSARGNLAEARSHFEESLSLKRSLGSKRDLTSTLMGLGNLAEVQEDFDSAIRYHQECLAISREIRDERATAMCLANLGSATARHGEREKGVELLIESAKLHEVVGGEMFFARSLVMIALLPGIEEHDEWVAPVLAAGVARLESLGVTIPPAIRDEIAEKQRRLDASLGHARLLMLSEEGRSMADSTSELIEHLTSPR